MAEAQLSIYPLFPHTLALCTLNQTDIDSDALEYVKGRDYTSTSFEAAHSKSKSSTSYDVLEELPKLKSSILRRFYLFKDKYLFYTKNDFVITTSWSTRTRKGDYSKFHNHQNSFYSGVFYFGGDADTAKIRFNNPYRRTLWVESTKLNELNMEQFRITPHKNLLIFFPSYIDHAIQEHQSDTVRYSIAFNLMPVGQLGMEDSGAYIEIPDPGTADHEQT